ncbi:sulfatase-like hydrolase/transferase [Agaribacillus aureus]
MIIMNNRRLNPVTGMIWVFLAFLMGCEQSDSGLPNDPGKTPYQTKNVVIIVIDGPRFSETWGDPSKQYIPNLGKKLARQGVQYNWFYNNGPTYTTSGHTALTTGRYQIMQNDGTEFPHYPSLFQVWLSQTREDPNQAIIITGKEKLNVLADCSHHQWRGKFNPICVADNRPDAETLKIARSLLEQHHPQLLLIQFKGPDQYGHANDWTSYLNSIIETDRYVNDIWEFLQNDPHYQNTTTLFVTNDHGRHLDNVRDGFVNHGDLCEGCLHINLFAAGPDFKAGVTINTYRELTDLAPTVARLMGFTMPDARGEFLSELFK